MSPGERRFRAFAVAFALIVVVFVFTDRALSAPFTPELRMAYDMAVKHWGGPPEGCTSIDREIVYDDELADALGEASVPGPGEHIACFVYIRTELATPQYFIRACAVMRHEVGHLEGFEHSPDPRSIMFEHINLLPGECWKASLWLDNHPNFRRGGPRYA